MVKLVQDIYRVFAKHGLFDEGVEVIGSWCFQLYQKYLGVKKFPFRTPDIDFLIPFPFRGREHPDFIKDLEDLGFRLDFYKNGSTYLWKDEFRIEFLTPERGRGSEKAIPVKKLGLAAIPLRYLDLLFQSPVVVPDEGLKILLPHPARFCLHKLIVASRRKRQDKSAKDLLQAVAVGEIVRVKELEALFRSLPKGWRSTIMKMLEKSEEQIPMDFEDARKKLLLILQNVE